MRVARHMVFVDQQSHITLQCLITYHILDSIVQKTNRWRYGSAIGHAWSELIVQTSKHVSVENLASLSSHLMCAVCLCQCNMSHGKLTWWSKSKIFRFLHGFLAILANLGSEGWQGLSLKLLHGYVGLLAKYFMFEWFAWERHSLTTVILQLTHNSCQDKFQLNHALFCSSKRFLDFVFICLLALTFGVRYVPVPMQVITWLATVKLRDCCRPFLPSLLLRIVLKLAKMARIIGYEDHQSKQKERAIA